MRGTVTGDSVVAELPTDSLPSGSSRANDTVAASTPLAVCGGDVGNVRV
jgi:hypothetical protein